MRLPILAAAAALLLSGAQTASAVTLVNPGFEDPDFNPGSPPGAPTFRFVGDNGTVPGWHTTASDGVMEIWDSGFSGVPAFEGTQFAELNANVAGALYQEVAPVDAGTELSFYFAHRGRLGTDTMRLTITDLGLNGAMGGGDDTVLFTEDYADSNLAWGFYTNDPSDPIVSLGHRMRFSYEALNGGSFGNFLDDVNFGTNLPPPSGVPEPATLSLVAVGVLGAASRRRSRR